MLTGSATPLKEVSNGGTEHRKNVRRFCKGSGFGHRSIFFAKIEKQHLWSPSCFATSIK